MAAGWHVKLPKWKNIDSSWVEWYPFSFQEHVWSVRSARLSRWWPASAVSSPMYGQHQSVSNTLRPEQNGWHFADDFYFLLYFHEMRYFILITISLNFFQRNDISSKTLWAVPWAHCVDVLLLIIIIFLSKFQLWRNWKASWRTSRATSLISRNSRKTSEWLGATWFGQKLHKNLYSNTLPATNVLFYWGSYNV